jgi:hypothetical protein
MLRICIAALALVGAAPAFADDWRDTLAGAARNTDERDARFDQSLHNRIMEDHALREDLSRDSLNQTQERMLDQMQFDSIKRDY